jgi:hypothetical protein
MEFVRFGGLSSVNQRGYDPAMPGFHSPPARKGIYAFPQGCIVPFMLGGDRPGESKGSARYVRDKQGNKITDEEDLYTNYEARPYVYSASGEPHYPDRNFYKVYSTKKGKDGKHYWVRPAPMKKFSYEGRVWHHLGKKMKPSQILETKGSWFLSEIKDYQKAFSKESLELRMKSSEKGNINSVRGKFGYFAVDHLEVFIEKI